MPELHQLNKIQKHRQDTFQQDGECFWLWLPEYNAKRCDARKHDVHPVLNLAKGTTSQPLLPAMIYCV